MRLLHLIVVAALVIAAAYVYKIKFESTVQAERVAKLRTEIRRERDSIAALRAEWAQLDNPGRIQALAQRHLALRSIDPTQIESLDHLPARPADAETASSPDSIAALIDGLDFDMTTGSVGAPAGSGVIEMVPIEMAPSGIAPVETRPVEVKPGLPR
jgi:hypothetical protein